MFTIENSCCFTGYRPEKFDFMFNENSKDYRSFMSRLTTGISRLINNGCTTFYTGMAKGFDIIAAEQIALIKKLNPKIKLIAVIPFKNQQCSFSEDWKTRYNEVLACSDETVVLNERYESWAFDQRNRYMVDRCRYVITFFDGKLGGTKNTLSYASRRCRTIVNIFETDPLKEQKESFKPYYKIIAPGENG